MKGLVCLGRRGLGRLCGRDQFTLQNGGGGKVTFICSRLKGGGWRQERFEKGKKGESFLAGQARLLRWAEGEGSQGQAR